MKGNTLKITGHSYNLPEFRKRTYFGKDKEGFYRRGNLSIESVISLVIKPHIENKKKFIIIQNLVKNWDQIVGKKYAEFCYPKIININEKKSGKLTIGVYNSAIGFFLEQNSELILERIASLYGFKSISKIIIKQEPKDLIKKQADEIKITPEKEKFLEDYITKVEDKGLAETLRNLGKLCFKTN